MSLLDELRDDVASPPNRKPVAADPAPNSNDSKVAAPDLLAELVESAPIAGSTPRERRRAPTPVEIAPAAPEPEPEAAPAPVEAPRGGVPLRYVGGALLAVALFAVTLGRAGGAPSSAVAPAAVAAPRRAPADPFLAELSEGGLL